MQCYGYTDEQTCQIKAIDNSDFCHAHQIMYNMSLALQKHHDFFEEPKMYKLEYRYKLRYITDYRYMSHMYNMEKIIENKLKRFKHFFEAVTIQRCFKRATSDPNYKMCRDRLINEFKNLAF